MIDWTQLFNRYKGLWVALKDDEVTVVGSGQTLEKAMSAAVKSGYQNPIVMRVPETLATYIGFLDDEV